MREDIIYSKIAALYPMLEVLVIRLNLVSNTTGEKIIKVDVATLESTEAKHVVKLMELAKKILEKGSGRTKEELINRLQAATGVSIERAANGFGLMVQSGIIKQLENEGLYFFA